MAKFLSRLQVAVALRPDSFFETFVVADEGDARLELLSEFLRDLLEPVT